MKNKGGAKMKKKDAIKELGEEQSEGLLGLAEEESIKTAKIAKDAMIKPVFLYSDDNADTIIKKLKREDTNVCIVVTNDKKFIGEIGDEDLIKLFLHQVKYEPLVQILNIGYRREFLYKPAKSLINKHKSTVKLNDPLNKVIKLIYKEGFNYIPVLDDSKRVVGVITPSSLIDFLQKE
ncbi:MAG: CBS domain-containing protein [Nanoarchaeota archaeon]